MNIPVCDERRIWTLLSGSPSDKRDEEACHLGAEEQVHSGDQVPTSDAIKYSLYKMRYFIIKSSNHENIQLSIKKGLWATQIMNELILEEAFRNSGKELPQDIGEALCELLDGRDDVEINLKRDEVRDDLSSQCLYKEQLHSFQNEVYNVPPLHMEPMLGPSLLYQHQAEVDRYHLAHMRKNGLSAERCPHAFTLTDDDILEMTYEEYLEAHSRGYRWLPDPATGTSQSLQKSSSSKKHSDDSQVNLVPFLTHRK